MSKRPTIQAVADLAGVSRGTVDRVLNNRSYVNAEVRKRVLEAIAELGYVSPRESLRRHMDSEIKPLKLGVLLPAMESQPQFCVEVEQGIAQAREQLEPAHVQILIRRCKTDIPREALDFLDELVQEGVSGLSICALNDISIEKRVLELTEQGIPCITFNSDLPNSNRLCFVGEDSRKTGRVAADLLSRCIPASGIVLATIGNRRFDHHARRLDGFCERMEERGFSRDQILIAETFNHYEVTYSLVTEILKTHPDLAGVYMGNLNTCGCAEAIRAAGKHGQIRVVCHDINDAIRQLLQENSIDFTIPQDFHQQGYLPLVFLCDYLRKGRLPDQTKYRNHISIICAENA